MCMCIIGKGEGLAYLIMFLMLQLLLVKRTCSGCKCIIPSSNPGPRPDVTVEGWSEKQKSKANAAFWFDVVKCASFGAILNKKQFRSPNICVRFAICCPCPCFVFFLAFCFQTFFSKSTLRITTGWWCVSNVAPHTHQEPGAVANRLQPAVEKSYRSASNVVDGWFIQSPSSFCLFLCLNRPPCSPNALHRWICETLYIWKTFCLALASSPLNGCTIKKSVNQLVRKADVGKIGFLRVSSGRTHHQIGVFLCNGNC